MQSQPLCETLRARRHCGAYFSIHIHRRDNAEQTKTASLPSLGDPGFNSPGADLFGNRAERDEADVVVFACFAQEAVDV